MSIQKLAFMQWNPMHASTYERLQDISSHFARQHIIALNGDKIRKPKGLHCGPHKSHRSKPPSHQGWLDEKRRTRQQVMRSLNHAMQAHIHGHRCKGHRCGTTRPARTSPCDKGKKRKHARHHSDQHVLPAPPKSNSG